MPEWLWAVVVGGVLVGLIAYIWHTHERHDRERISQLWDQVGRDGEHGMRKILHRIANAFDAVVKEIPDLRRRVERLERRKQRENHEE